MLIPMLLACTPFLAVEEESHAALTEHWAVGSEFHTLGAGDLTVEIWHVHGTSGELSGLDPSDFQYTPAPGTPANWADYYEVLVSPTQTGGHGTWKAVQGRRYDFVSPCYFRGWLEVPASGFKEPWTVGC